MLTEEDRYMHFLSEQTNCRTGRGSAYKYSVGNCVTGNVGIDFGYEHFNKGELDRCISGCKNTECDCSAP